mgnify:CR=1 FL=1|tara:strand:+ start:1893 stop:2339 length:447 start_codon:yes stop_codon:yes gene_type:complete
MKNLSAIVITLFLSAQLSAQGNNLQFNRVVNLDFTVNNTSNYTWANAGTLTVGSNKVLKITSCSAFSGNTSDGYNNSGSMRIDNKLVYDAKVSYGEAGIIPNGIEMPVWLGAGTYTIYLYRKYSTNSFSSRLQQHNGSISGVEFNIVQ